jgi:glycerophosphoryl diester phosphodiesterase
MLVWIVAAALSAGMVARGAARSASSRDGNRPDRPKTLVQTGPRPLFLVRDLEDGWLKQKLSSCSDDRLRPTDFTIGHRGGATLQFPEETREDFEAGIGMGAGVLECDVTFTKDLELVCRHAQNDLHTTTNILVTPLASKCTRPFTPPSSTLRGGW